jgi:hypothetical protein
MNVPTLYLGVLGSMDPSPWSLSGPESGVSLCTFGFSGEESNKVTAVVDAANVGVTDVVGCWSEDGV